MIDLIRQQVRVVVDPMILALKQQLFGHPNATQLQGAILPAHVITNIVVEQSQQGTIPIPVQTRTFRTAVAIGAGTAVACDANQRLLPVLSNNPMYAKRCIGIAQDSVPADEDCRVVLYGVLQLETVWNFTPGSMLFIQANGSVSPQVPTAGFIQAIGYTITNNTAFVAVSPAIYLL